ncbi:MAG: oxidoreductase [Candidatus Hydrogenedentota bacterium]
MSPTTRRSFLKSVGMTAGIAAGASHFATAQAPAVQGFDDTSTTLQAGKVWTPVSDRRIRMGIVGYGFCQFGAAFGLQNHPNVEVVAVSDLIPDRCAGLAKACRCEKTYESLEAMVKDDRIEAIFVATDAPNHAQHCINVLKHGKHVASAVPAVFGSLEDADRLFETVKSTGLKYMMFETTVFRNDCFAMRQIYDAGAFGRMTYTEGEYYHYMEQPLDSFKGWRIGLPPQWYPTHSNAYYTGVTGGHFTEVSCMGIPSKVTHLMASNNTYKNPFGTEIALFRASDGGMARMAVSWDTPGYENEIGRCRGEKGSMVELEYEGVGDISRIMLEKPPLPPNVDAGGHGGSHGYLGNEFVESILLDRKPLVDIAWALNMTVAGIVAHKSALKDGKLLKIPRYAI